MLVLIAVGLVAVYVAWCFLARAHYVRLAQATPKPTDSPHAAETRDILLTGAAEGGMGFGDRVALSAQLDRILALPEANVPALADWESS